MNGQTNSLQQDPEGLRHALAVEIQQLNRGVPGRGFIVGIDGKGCSGKSRLAKQLVAELQRLGTESTCVSIDEFCNPREVRNTPSVPEGLQVYYQNFDERTWIEEILEPFHSTGRLHFDRMMLDPRHDTFTNRVHLDLRSPAILVAEGLHLLKRSVQDLFSFSILLHISERKQLARALVRDARERGKTEEEVRSMYAHRYIPSFRHYLLEDAPCKRADVIIDVEDPSHPVVLLGEHDRGRACE